MTDTPSLARRAIKAAKWGYLGAAGKLVIQLGAQIVLARLLGPNEYGLFAIGTIVVGLSNFLADAGIGAVLVQKAEIDDDLIKFVAGWQWLAGGLVMGALWIFAPALADYFSEPRSIEVIRAMSLVCLLGAICSTPSNLLRRRLEFKPLQLAQLLGFFIGYVLVGIPCAWMGAGVWSLVLAWLTQATVTCIYVYAAARPPLGVKLIAKEGIAILKFGGGALLSNLSTWAGSNADKVIVGRFFSTYDLGLYNAVNNLLSTAVTQVLSTLQSVLFSASSRISSDKEQMGRSCLILIEVGAMLFMPVFGCVAAIPEVVLVGLYGSHWQAGANVLTPIALSMAAYGLAGLVTPLLWASGKIRAEGQIQLVGAIAIAVATLIIVQYKQLDLIAWAVFICVLIRALVSILYASRILNLKFTEFFKCIRMGLCTAFGVSYILREFCDLLLIEFLQTLQVTFILAIPFAVIIYLLSASIGIRYIGSDAANSILRRMPLFRSMARY